jgi:hypothetical protein
MLFQLKKLPEVINLTRFLKSFFYYVESQRRIKRVIDNDLIDV